MSNKYRVMSAAIMAALTTVSGGSGGGSGSSSFVQSGQAQSNTVASTLVATMTSTSAAGHTLFLWGMIKSSAAGSATTLAVTDDKSNAWTVDVTCDPGGGNSYKVFIASCLNTAAGTKVLTVTATGGTIAGTLAWAEVSGVTGRLANISHSSSGSNEVSPLTVTNSAANSTAHAIALHAFTVSGPWTSNYGITASSTTGTLMQVAINQDSTGNMAPGYAGYIIDTAVTTDAVTDAWTTGTSITAQVIASYSTS